MALEEQYRRMLKLKEHFKIEGEIGYKPWYELGAGDLHRSLMRG